MPSCLAPVLKQDTPFSVCLQPNHTHTHRSASPFKHIFVNMPDDII
nr:MAG TPA: hypothetical protein [Caudoviricetes sp.]